VFTRTIFEYEYDADDDDIYVSIIDKIEDTTKSLDSYDYVKRAHAKRYGLEAGLTNDDQAGLAREENFDEQLDMFLNAPGETEKDQASYLQRNMNRHNTKRHVMKKLTVAANKQPGHVAIGHTQSSNTMDRGGKKKTVVHGVNMPIFEHKLQSGQDLNSRKDSEQLSDKGMNSVQMSQKQTPSKGRGTRKQTMKLANYRGGKKHTVLDKNFQPKKIDPNALWQQAGYDNSNKSGDKSIDTYIRNEQDSFNDVKKDDHLDRRNSEILQKSDRILFQENGLENTAEKKSDLVRNKANPLENKVIDDSVDLDDEI